MGIAHGKSSKVECYKVGKSIKKVRKKSCKGKKFFDVTDQGKQAAIEYLKQRCGKKKRYAFNEEKNTCEKSKKKKDKSSRYCKKIERLKKKKSASDQFKQEVDSILKEKKCSKETYKDLKKKLKGAKSGSRYCKKIERLKKKKNASDAVKKEIDELLAKKECSKRIYQGLKQKIRQSKGNDKFCSKIGKLVKKAKTDDVKQKLEEMSQAQACTKAQYKEAKCIAKGKEWLQMSGKGKFKCTKKKGRVSLATIKLIKIKLDGKKKKKCNRLIDKMAKRARGDKVRIKDLKRLKKNGCLDYKEVK